MSQKRSLPLWPTTLYRLVSPFPIRDHITVLHIFASSVPPSKYERIHTSSMTGAPGGRISIEISQNVFGLFRANFYFIFWQCSSHNTTPQLIHSCKKDTKASSSFAAPTILVDTQSILQRKKKSDFSITVTFEIHKF